MRRTIVTALTCCILFPLTGQHLITGESDRIGLESWARSPYLVESGTESFFMVSGANFSSVDHPLLKEVYNDFANIFFLHYGKDGKPFSSNYIRGASSATAAFSHRGGLTLVAYAGGNVDASGNELFLNGANNLEFIASYTGDCELRKIVSVWNLGELQSAYSEAAMDRREGSLFLFGVRNEPAELAGWGMIGEKWPGRFLYVVKYSNELEVQWAYSAGFDRGDPGFGYFNELKVHPDGSGGAILTGVYESDQMQPVFGEATLPFLPESTGLFAVRLNGNGTQSWVMEGTAGGYSSGTYIHEGMPLPGGDMLMAGVTTTGYFRLGEAEFTFLDGGRFANQLVFRIRPDGSLRWSRGFRTMGKSVSQEKKAAGTSPRTREPDSDEFEEDLYYDARLWNGEVLYLAGTYLSDSFQVAGTPLEKSFGEGIFVASVDVETGEELWGYGLSSGWAGIHGFDADGSGNVSLMGYTDSRQEVDGYGIDSVPGKDLLLMLGMDFEGNPLWRNNAYMQNSSYGLHGADLEVLPGGELFASFYTSQADQIQMEDTLLASNLTYDSWVVSLVSGSELGGRVTRSGGNPFYPGYLKAFKASPSGAFPAVDSVGADESGNFVFRGLYPGSYTLQAYPESGAPSDVAPTYLGDQLFWRDARFLDVETDTRAGFLEIQMLPLPVMSPGGGAGTLSGTLSYEEDPGGTLKGELGRPVKKASVILIKKPARKSALEDEVVAWAETDDLGSYVFENVPDGDYLLIVNITGLDMIETHEVRIEGNVIVSGLDYTVGGDGIYTWGGVGVRNHGTDPVRIYPNPGDGQLWLESPGTGRSKVEVYSPDGRLMARFVAAGGAGRIDLSALKPGIYMIRVHHGEGISTLRYVKRQAAVR